MDDRKAIAARIKALLSKTTENGATEAEAMSAALKARELVDKYHIEHGELGMQAEGTAKGATNRSGYKSLGIKWRMAANIQEFCDVKCWGERGKIVFFGLQSDVDFATWLIESLDAFVQRAAAEYMVTLPASKLNHSFKMPRWEAEKSFVLGAVHRINDRLEAMTDARKREMAASGSKSLIVLKSAVVNRALKELGMKFRSGGSSKTAARDGGAYHAGAAAGDRASFGRPVGSEGGGQRLIGR